MTQPGGPSQGWDPPPPPPGGRDEPPIAPPPPPPAPGAPPVPPGGGTPPPGYPTAPGHPTPPGYPPGPGYPSQPGYGAQPFGYASPYPQAPRNEPLAIAGLVCGIIAVPFFCGVGLVLGVLGLVFGIIAMKRIDRSAGALTGRGMALAGAICGGVGIAFNVIYWGIVIIAMIADSSN